MITAQNFDEIFITQSIRLASIYYEIEKHHLFKVILSYTKNADTF